MSLTSYIIPPSRYLTKLVLIQGDAFGKFTYPTILEDMKCCNHYGGECVVQKRDGSPGRGTCTELKKYKTMLRQTGWCQYTKDLRKGLSEWQWEYKPIMMDVTYGCACAAK